ncbi:hypothetical protein Cni_G09484 [Canna indica]|uniref:DUF4283 domain-containing protein n=1 Tax=Canna indica TaxID=4628 RepID=A0AAQ3Q6H8_9LILI|nr:hypothetical protein Cni_G09484 [Canna indica]
MPKIWRTKFSLHVIDPASSFFCFKFTSNEDLNHVLTNGPWFLNGQVLLTVPWKPNFQPLLEKIESIPVWIQFPSLLVEYLHRDILFKLAEAVGQPIKCDEVTVKGTKGKYARVCVLWNSNKNLPNGIWINCMNTRFCQAIASENTSKLYFGCGRIGHLIVNCNEKRRASDKSEVNNLCNSDAKTYTSQDSNAQKVDKMKATEEADDGNLYGPWQVVNRKKRHSSQKKSADKIK